MGPSRERDRKMFLFLASSLRGQSVETVAYHPFFYVRTAEQALGRPHDRRAGGRDCSVESRLRFLPEVGERAGQALDSPRPARFLPIARRQERRRK
jgi:hypothetical protein